MEWYWVVAITLVAVWIVTTILAQFSSDVAVFWGMGLIYPALYILAYPIRAWNQYSSVEMFYKKHGITRVKYLIGFRVRKGGK